MKRGLLIGLVAGALVLVLVWWVALYSPTSKDVDDTKTQVSVAERKADGLRTTLSRLQELARNAPQQQALLRKLDAAVPETPDLADFILQANQIATETGIDFLSIAPSPPAASTTGTTSVINLQIQIEGGFFQVLEYLNKLEDLSRLVIVDTISLQGSAGSAAAATTPGSPAASATTSSSGLAVSLTGRMFTRAAVASAGAVPGTGGTTTPTTPGASGTTTPTTPSSGDSTTTTVGATTGSGNS